MRWMSIGGALLALTVFFCLAHSAMPGPDARQLWHHIDVQSPYATWSFWQRDREEKHVSAHSGQRFRVFVNETGRSSNARSVEFGTIVVKENLDRDEAVQTVSVMYKVRDYNPHEGDWFWARYSADGKVVECGRMKGCIGCHSTVQQNDYLFTRRSSAPAY